MISPYLKARITRDLTNFSLVRQPSCEGHIVSLHQSGTHWLRHMLSVLIARLYGLPEPAHIQDNNFVLPPKQASKYTEIPRIVSSHSIVSPLLTNRLALSVLHLPKYVLLVRDPRMILVSHYQREKSRYKMSFAEYLRADLNALHKAGRRKFDKDIWWDIRFQNSWGKMLTLLPRQIHLVRYEDMRRNTSGHLQQIASFLGLLEASGEDLSYAIARSSKEAMSQKEAPNAKYTVVRKDDARPLAIYSEEDKRFFLETYRKYCKADFGYDLEAGW
ncbi:sulfotransferase domain-containing protein [Betaproteobacteria bacterium SCN2]|jgi:hypothetical protein|nr:sulfotransferase domain-containing protein [Betaproteobacteria bacterium SCN2]